MQKKHQVHNLIILDESGSMNSIKSIIIDGFNELIKSVKEIENQFPEQEHFVSLISFNDLDYKTLHFVTPVAELKAINDERYNPISITPLYDAMGFSISKLKLYLEGKDNYSVLVTILTDGEENASKEYSGLSIVNLVTELKKQNWTFTYLGTDHDVEGMAATINIFNTIYFDKDGKGIKKMFAKETASRIKYSLGIRNGKLVNEDFYSRFVHEVKN
jgi:hypothetical protein